MGLADEARAQVEANRRREAEERDRLQMVKPDWGPELITALRDAEVTPVPLFSDPDSVTPITSGWMLVQKYWVDGDLGPGGDSETDYALSEDGRWFTYAYYYPQRVDKVVVSSEMKKAGGHAYRDVAVAALTALLEGSATRTAVGISFRKTGDRHRS